jgi:HK97 family phage major capsid protein
MNKKIRELQARNATAVTAMRAISDSASALGREPNAEEITAFDGHKAAVDANNAAIAREQSLIAAEASVGVVVPDNANISVSDNIAADPKRGFKSMGEFYAAVAQAGMKKSFDQRLGINAAAPTTFSNEAGGQDGGFAIPPGFSTELWRLSLGEESMLPMTANTEIGGNSMIFPKDESTPWGGSGANVYWQQEAAAGAQSKVQIGTQAMVLHKLMGIVPVTNELVEDGFAIGSYLTPLLADRITWKVNEAILFGTGVGQPLGILTNAGATGSPTIVQAKEVSQATLTLDPKNITKMVQRLLVGELKNSIWIATPDILTPLEALTVGQFPVYLPNTNLAESPYGMLKGRPLVLSEHAAAFSAQSDLSLLSLRGYRTITKAGGIQTDTSMHLFFDADATAMRIRFRMNGQPILGAPVVPPKSGNTRSHFVTLQAR